MDIHRAFGPATSPLRFKGTLYMNGEVVYWSLASPVLAANPPRFVAVSGAASAEGKESEAVFFASHMHRHLQLLFPATLQELNKYTHAHPAELLSAIPPPYASCRSPAFAGDATTVVATEQQQQQEREVVRLCTEATRTAMQQEPLLQVQLPIDTQQRQGLTAAVRCFQWEAATQAQNLLVQLLLQEPRAALPLWPQLLRAFADILRSRPSLREIVAELFVRILRAADTIDEEQQQQPQLQLQKELQQQQEIRFWATVPRTLPSVKLGVELLIQLRSLCLLGLMSVGLLDLHFNSEFSAYKALVEAQEKREETKDAAASVEGTEEGTCLTAPAAARQLLRQVASELLHPLQQHYRKPLVIDKTVNGISSGGVMRCSAATSHPLVAVDNLRLSRQGFLNPALLLQGLEQETSHPYCPVTALTGKVEAFVPPTHKDGVEPQQQRVEYHLERSGNPAVSLSAGTSSSTNMNSRSDGGGTAFCLGDSPLFGGELSPGFSWARGSVIRFCRLSGTRLGDTLRFYSQGEPACVAAYRSVFVTYV